MKRLFCIILAAAGCFASNANTGFAAIFYESGTLGPTGVTWNDLLSGNVPGSNVASDVFVGVRFQLAQPIVTTGIGGHFAAPDTGTFFGAIVALQDENDFPDSGNLSTPDVLGATVLTFPVPSAEIIDDLTLSLDSGWYALVFGSGLFGASGGGGAPQNNPDIGNPAYIAFQPGSVLGWGNLLNPIFRNYRFVVQGRVVPEPGAVGLMTMVLLFVLFTRTPNR